MSCGLENKLLLAMQFPVWKGIGAAVQEASQGGFLALESQQLVSKVKAPAWLHTVCGAPSSSTGIW